HDQASQENYDGGRRHFDCHPKLNNGKWAQFKAAPLASQNDWTCQEPMINATVTQMKWIQSVAKDIQKTLKKDPGQEKKAKLPDGAELQKLEQLSSSLQSSC